MEMRLIVMLKIKNKNQIDTKAEMRFKRRGGKKDFEQNYLTCQSRKR